MKFAFFGYDYTIDIAKALIAEGHTLLELFSFPCDQMFTFNDQAQALAKELGIKMTQAPVNTAHIEELIEKNCTLFLTAGYPHKIPTIDENNAYAVNIHPSLLPKARGIMPLPHIIMTEPEAAGFTIHKMNDKFDDGDILYQEPLNITHETDVEILSAQIAIRCPQVTCELVRHLPKFWTNATPQNQKQKSQAPAPDQKARTLDWTNTIEHLNRQCRAFSRFGTIAHVQNQRFVVFNAKGWNEDHKNTPGDILRVGPREIIIAAQDGYICLKEFQLLAE